MKFNNDTAIFDCDIFNDMKKVVKVIAGVVKVNNKFLVARRSHQKSLGGKWEFPGGKIEEGETYENALIREFKEELSVQIEVYDLIKEISFVKDRCRIEVTFFQVEILEGDIILNEHIEYEYIDKENLSRKDLCSADRELIKFL